MLAFKRLDELPDPVVSVMSKAEQAIINDMARRIAKTGIITDTAEYQAARLEAIGVTQEDLLKKLSAATGKTKQELVRLFDEAATRTLATDDKIYRAAGYSPIPLAENPYMQQIIFAGLEKTNWEFINLTRTTAATATGQFERALDITHQKMVSGTFSYQEAIKAGIRELTTKGLQVTRYPTGHTDYLDVAFRRATLTGTNQTAGTLQLARMDETQHDLVETSAHPGARPTHAEWQGQIFSRSGTSRIYRPFSDTGCGTGPGLCGWNCRHSFFPYFEGLSERAYTLEKLREYNNATVMYNGKPLSVYDASQIQRYHERQIRRWKREAAALEAAGLDSVFAIKKIRDWQAAQRDFIEQTHSGRDYFRERAGKQFTA